MKAFTFHLAASSFGAQSFHADAFDRQIGKTIKINLPGGATLDAILLGAQISEDGSHARITINAFDSTLDTTAPQPVGVAQADAPDKPGPAETPNDTGLRAGGIVMTARLVWLVSRGYVEDEDFVAFVDQIEARKYAEDNGWALLAKPVEVLDWHLGAESGREGS